MKLEKWLIANEAFLNNFSWPVVEAYVRRVGQPGVVPVSR
jgi:hypothetical protein